ncbi:MAG: hypothetical protein C4551_07725 [Bacillota bacterium]|nr:MAG: hypothetical protein C4551_07725 [Bacillota bacterium]
MTRVSRSGLLLERRTDAGLFQVVLVEPNGEVLLERVLIEASGDLDGTPTVSDASSVHKGYLAVTGGSTWESTTGGVYLMVVRLPGS